AFYTIIYVTKGASLFAIPPNLNFRVAGQLSDSDFPAHGGRRLLPATIPGSQWSEDIVKTHYAGFKPVILSIVRAQPLSNQLLPAVGILWLGPLSIFFLKPTHVHT